MPRRVCEYIWIDGFDGLRSKTRVLGPDFAYIPDWNYDGSSTGQAEATGNTEVILKPVAIYTDPLRDITGYECNLVLCDISGGARSKADHIFDQGLEEEPWFGIEQEYVMVFPEYEYISSHDDGLHYCGTNTSSLEREIAEEHLTACLTAGLTISGINAEVSTRQWEFQIGPATGLDAADQVYVARYLLERIAEKHCARINYHPKPCAGANGSGCHINFSTRATRGNGGLDVIKTFMPKLADKHDEHIAVYGLYNDLRLTGKHETSSFHGFSFGEGTRNTSVRIPNQTVTEGCGYFEDRRPAANVEVYAATAMLFHTCCLT
jgi:glutamine synthetase